MGCVLIFKVYSQKHPGLSEPLHESGANTMPNQSILMDEVIQQIKVAIAEVQRDGSKPTISKATIELKHIQSVKVGRKWEFKIPFIDLNTKIGADQTNEKTTSIKLVLKPRVSKPLRVEHEPLTNELISAIAAIKVGITSAVNTDPPFELETAEATVLFNYDQNGNIEILGFGGSAKASAAHSVTLTLGEAASK
jgi:hypothetical protein